MKIDDLPEFAGESAGTKKMIREFTCAHEIAHHWFSGLPNGGHEVGSINNIMTDRIEYVLSLLHKP